MRRWLTILGTGLLVSALTVPAVAKQTVTTLQVRLVDTHAFGIPADQLDLAPGNTPGSSWVSNDIWHMRRVPVTDTMDSLDGETTMGYLERSVNFNWDLGALAEGEVQSTAWCSYTMTLTDPALGTFEGHCRGTLLAGTVVANGPSGHQQGTYTLEAGGVPSIGPYLLDLEIRER